MRVAVLSARSQSCLDSPRSHRKRPPEKSRVIVPWEGDSSMRNRTILATAALFATGALLGWLAGVGHWSKPAQAQDKQPADAQSEGAGPKPATEHTRKANAAFARTLPFADQRDFDEARKGLIAPLPGGGVVKNGDDRVVLDPRRYDFLKPDGDAPDTVNPSLWRQAQLLSLTGLFQVTEHIYQ